MYLTLTLYYSSLEIKGENIIVSSLLSLTSPITISLLLIIKLLILLTIQPSILSNISPSIDYIYLPIVQRKFSNAYL